MDTVGEYGKARIISLFANKEKMNNTITLVIVLTEDNKLLHKLCKIVKILEHAISFQNNTDQVSKNFHYY